MTIRELLSLHTASTEELRSRGVVRTSNSPVGDYTEWLVSRALDLELASNSASGFDALDSSGTRYQIKGRRVTARNNSRQLGAIRNLDSTNFDFLVAIVFDEAFEVIEAVKIPHTIVKKYARLRRHVNGHVLYARGEVLSDRGVFCLKDQLASVKI